MKEELELYIHIPFCVKKCAYCDFLSAPANKEEQGIYVQALIREIETYKEMAGGYIVTSVFFGGGTPSILESRHISNILQTIHQTFKMQEQREITIEVNPGTITKEKLEVYKNIGINRISIGLQSVENEELKVLGRIHSYEVFQETYHLVRHLGFTNVNIDLISAIPGQTCQSWMETITAIAQLEPEHISAYSLIVEEGTPFYEMYGGGENNQQVLPLPTEEEERQMYEDTQRILSEYGYQRYEISNYAKAGYECQHNIGYWKRRSYLGFGIGAASLIRKTRFSNVTSIEQYCTMYGQQQKSIMHVQEELLTEQMEREETIFLGLRMIEGIELTEEIEYYYKSIIQKFVEQDFLIRRDGRLSLTEKGISVSNYILSEFL